MHIRLKGNPGTLEVKKKQLMSRKKKEETEKEGDFVSDLVTVIGRGEYSDKLPVMFHEIAFILDLVGANNHVCEHSKK